MAIAGWRFPQPQGDQSRLGGSVQQFGSGRRRPFLAHQGGLEAFQNELPPHVLHGPTATAHCLADLLVLPTRTVHVGFEQDHRSPQFLRLILYAAISETSSNRWKLSVISDSRLSAWVVEMPSMTSLMAA